MYLFSLLVFVNHVWLVQYKANHYEGFLGSIHWSRSHWTIKNNNNKKYGSQYNINLHWNNIFFFFLTMNLKNLAETLRQQYNKHRITELIHIKWLTSMLLVLSVENRAFNYLILRGKFVIFICNDKKLSEEKIFYKTDWFTWQRSIYIVGVYKLMSPTMLKAWGHYELCSDALQIITAF